MIRINAQYDEVNEVLLVALPYVEIEADRKSQMLTYREHSEGVSRESKVGIGNVAFGDVLNIIANNLKEYAL